MRLIRSPKTLTLLTLLLVAGLRTVNAYAYMPHIRHSYFFYGDLRAFYCAARVTINGGDPYRAEPIGSCERDLVDIRNSDFVVPAPLAGDAIALFVPLARLDFWLAAIMWSVTLACIFAALSLMLARLIELPLSYWPIILLPLALIIPIDLGQLVPVSVALLVGATLALRAERNALAGLLAVLSTIEPHIGLPATIALFLYRPSARPALLVSAVASIVVSLRVVGPAALAEYAHDVLPLHIASEARYDDQYSLTYALTWLDVPVRYAIALGTVSYWTMVALGVVLARRLSITLDDTRYLVFVPTALSVVGGPYVHQEHLLAAVPLAALLASSAAPASRALPALALALVAWPGKFVFGQLGIPGMFFIIGTDRIGGWAHGLVPFADAAWALRIAAHSGSVALFAAKLPTWIGLIMMLAILIARLRSTSTQFARVAYPATSGAPALNAR